MATADIPTQQMLTVLPERERVCLRPAAVLDSRALGYLEEEAHALATRGFAQMTIDLREVETIDYSTAATLAAISRLARHSGARLNVIPGRSPAVQELLRAGLMNDLAIETPAPRPFFDWSR
ncbi:MAG TPA: STAS domain-containing protein [Solirubrobacteraceae bacterium]|jgi:anti-anti-sigma regulatory factor|nr:STAS domain-containing protein [Solirubrobacteraceae bacterium]